ncbi:DUF5804 family protein [Halanaeroarchaeum sulfurireducens]|uniref:Uncharacterized protein n=1 Tax=Halanaeroarchaeum sulfurireducens TaxID=1604004 RepID=A0A0F7PBJ4_9EURY|nr:DUF5804 family protein [Halanaeroarchaeum sulfurireducens]AKH98062.1 hypothetical protein HLASF_1584 [Halanaeroarchaeum sulfurireducens]ALG82456.1 hypothetical protein HLASA_1571 [Halanaeroarchaeum sulfurireducens]
MTRVCIIGTEDGAIRADLLAYETARSALAPYDLAAPFENAIAVDTVSLGAAVSLLNDLNWYLVRLARATLVRDRSISETEWLSRELATRIRNGETTPVESGDYLKIYGVDDGRLVEPMYAARTVDGVPEYDLRDVSDTVVVRVTESEFGD